MFKNSLVISLSIFFISMILTSTVKNNTRNIEKNIEKLEVETFVLEKELSDAKIDFIYLSTPEKLREKLTDLTSVKYLSYDYSRIFLSTQDFVNHASQETKNFKIKNK